MRARFLVLSSALAVSLFAAGCAEDEDLAGTAGATDTGGQSATGDAEPGDSTMPADTGTPEDSTVADSGTPPVDTGMKDTSIPDIFGLDTAGFDTAAVDTAILDGFVGPECKVAADCPFMDTVCAKRECVSGRCRVAFVAPDTVVTPKKGDCKVEQCDGAGKVKILEDLTDVPDAMGECTLGVCTAMGPGVANKTAGTPCSTGYCDATGKCVECVVGTMCPGTDSECAVRGCVANKCAMVNIADGTVAATQVPGDCKIRLCDGKGGVRIAEASTDNDDGQICTDDSCVTVATEAGVDWVPQHTNASSETLCGTDLYCGSPFGFRGGKCGDCDVADDCTRAAKEFVPTQGISFSDSCRKPTCTDHQCGTMYDPPGTACTSYGSIFVDGGWTFGPCSGTCYHNPEAVIGTTQCMCAGSGGT
jgi:hypothetical protein